MYSYFPFTSGNTYDRPIVVDEEEASIMLYDIWEQVSPYIINIEVVLLLLNPLWTGG